MKKLIMFAYFVIFALSLTSNEGYSTWLSEIPKVQLLDESVDDQLSLGRLFVPVMTFPDWEPEIKIYNSADMIVVEGNRAGKSVFLKPGRYTVLFGSSNDPFSLIQKKFDIYEHQTTIIEPDWAGLIVSVLNQNMEFVRYGYEIMNMATGISVGSRYSREESGFNDINYTWILPPGKYKVVRQGETFNTNTNFATFELKAGELTEMSIVINDLLQFTGAGELGVLENYNRGKKEWSNTLNLKGSVTVYSHNKDNEDENTTDIISQAKIDNKIIYDSKPYYLNLRQSLKEEWAKTEALDGIRISLDELNFKNTGIYYFTNVFGIFGELNLGTKIFPASYFDINAPVLKIERNGDSLYLGTLEKFKVSEPFAPVTTEEKFGLNFTLVKSSNSNFYLRTGFGFFQNFNSRVYSLESSSSALYTFKEQKDTYRKGLTASAGGDFNFTNNITYSTVANLFYDLDHETNYNLKWENDFVFKLFRYISIDYNFIIIYDYSESSDSNYIIYDNRLALEFSYFIYK
jgi:hypothetical protein